MAEQNITLGPDESREVLFEAIPPEAKVYQVSVDGLTGSFRAIVAPGQQLSILNGDIVILQVCGKYLKNVSGLTAELVEPIVVNRMRDLEVSVRFKNVGMDVRPGQVGFTIAVGFQAKSVAPTMAGSKLEWNCRWIDTGYDPPWYYCDEYDCEKGPKYTGRSATLMGNEGTARLGIEISGAVWWCAGWYDLQIQCGTIPWDVPWIYGRSQVFTIKNAVQCLSGGYVWTD